jgi:RimJ/RimL family protein N-acetyltransferase
MDITLRPLAESDVDDLLAFVNDPEVVGNFAALGHITRDQELAWIREMAASKTDRVWAIVGPDGRFLGNCGIHKIWWPARNGRLGIVVGARDVHGRGVGTAALRMLLQKGFDELGLHKLWLVHYATNERMRHVATKLGLTPEGVLRDEYFHQGRFHDMVRHAILEEEWRAKVAEAGRGIVERLRSADYDGPSAEELLTLTRGEE